MKIHRYSQGEPTPIPPKHQQGYQKQPIRQRYNQHLQYMHHNQVPQTKIQQQFLYRNGDGIPFARGNYAVMGVGMGVSGTAGGAYEGYVGGEFGRVASRREIGEFGGWMVNGGGAPGYNTKVLNRTNSSFTQNNNNTSNININNSHSIGLTKSNSNYRHKYSGSSFNQNQQSNKQIVSDSADQPGNQNFLNNLQSNRNPNPNPNLSLNQSSNSMGNNLNSQSTKTSSRRTISNYSSNYPLKQKQYTKNFNDNVPSTNANTSIRDLMDSLRYRSKIKNKSKGKYKNQGTNGLNGSMMHSSSKSNLSFVQQLAYNDQSNEGLSNFKDCSMAISILTELLTNLTKRVQNTQKQLYKLPKTPQDNPPQPCHTMPPTAQTICPNPQKMRKNSTTNFFSSTKQYKQIKDIYTLIRDQNIIQAQYNKKMNEEIKNVKDLIPKIRDEVMENLRAEPKEGKDDKQGKKLVQYLRDAQKEDVDKNIVILGEKNSILQNRLAQIQEKYNKITHLVTLTQHLASKSIIQKLSNSTCTTTNSTNIGANNTIFEVKITQKIKPVNEIALNAINGYGDQKEKQNWCVDQYVYYMDCNGYLLDNNKCYILDDSNNMVQLYYNQQHLDQLKKRCNLINFIDKQERQLQGLKQKQIIPNKGCKQMNLKDSLLNQNRNIGRKML